MRYIDKILTIPSDEADNALILGHAIHTGIEKGVDAAVKEYFMAYPIITDNHINEAIKLEYLIPKVQAILPKGEFELKIADGNFIGFMDLLTPVEPIETVEQGLNGGKCICKYEAFDLYDFKYSNNSEKYADSRQLHLYKQQFEMLNPGKKIRNMYFVMIPKVNIKQKKTEDLLQFRRRIESELSKTKIELLEIEYDPNKVIEHWLLTKQLLETSEFPKGQSWLCKYCEYENYCMKGNDFMNLPSVERRNISETKKRKIWIYGAAFSGKTTMLDDAPNPLNLNTDGNIEFVTMPYISIKDEVKVEGRITKRKYAWEVFKEVITELEKKQNDFQTIIIDLLEDTREMCRVYMYDQLKIQHESDSGYGKGWDIIKTEYLSTIRRFFNLDYENIVVVSHEDVSKDITKKNGQNITRIAPNIQDAIANKIAGMVDIVARVVVEDDSTRTLNFKSNEVIFGGGRLKGIQQTTIPLSWASLMEVYDEANKNAVATLNGETVQTASTGRRARKKTETPTEADIPTEVQEAEKADAENAEMNAALAEQVEPNSGEPLETPADEEKPKVRTRRKRGE